jgi:selenocysteine-specific elongation factor
MIVATAGHIDHGKTLLVRTLTGVDTDRLPEEKARGISIDLGFAYLTLQGGEVIGFVDVPGHERFIRNMLAGVCGIDFALLVVAADDGIMPQTLEHLHILDLLHVPRAAAAITKIDRVDAGRTREVAGELEALLASTRLAGAPLLPVSALSGEGIGALRDLLAAEAQRPSARRGMGQHFRYAIDRAFTVAGSGTVVTGTVFNGSVRSGERVLISPAGDEVRVRGIQMHGQPAASATAGERCALNLAGTGLEEVKRGDWVLAPELHRPTRRIDARVTVLPAEPRSLGHWTPVHLHLATGDVTARVATRRGEAVPPGAAAIVQLVLDHPIGALRGDRFILRDQSAMRTLGGGIVLDPFAPATRRSTPTRLAELAALEHDDPEAALRALLATREHPVDLTRFEVNYNLPREHAQALYERVGVVQLGREPRIGITHDRHEQARQAILTHLAEFHRRQPQAAGEDVEALRQATAPWLASEAYSSVLRALAAERRIEASGSTARLPGHDATANAADDRMWQAVRPVLESAGFNAPPMRELAQRLKLKEAMVKDFLHRKAKSGEVMKVTAERFYTRATVASLAAIAQATAQAQPSGQFTAAQYRDATGLGRSLAIEILEFLDTLAITQRIGDVRKIRKDYVPILGEARLPPQSSSRSPARPAVKAQGAPRRTPHPHRR